MVTLTNIGLGLILTTLGLVTLPTKGIAYNFHYTQEESEIFNTNFNTSNRWRLNGTKIGSGIIKATSPWGKASYSLTPVNLNQGDVFIYWSGLFPSSARTESDKYYLGLQYADNPPVCYNTQANQIVGSPPCSGSSVTVVDENAELKVEMRPRDRTNLANTYHRLYVDPDFDPVNNYSPTTTRLNIPSYQEAIFQDFRLSIRKGSSTQYEATLSNWNGVSWQLITPKQGYSSPLIIKDLDWIDDNRQINNPVTFEAINLQFRQAASTRQSALTAIALTQVRSQPEQLQPQSVKVPEPSTTFALPIFLGLGMLSTKQKRKKNL